jgi:predicted methyltransferase
MRTATLACLTAAATIVVACASPDPGAASRDSAAARARIETIVASADRSDADRKNDVRRKPVELLAFTGVRPGMTVLDVSSGGGYTTELLARAVAPGGRVYAQTPRPPSPALAARLQKPVAADVTSVVRPFESAPPTEAAGTLDLVTLMFNYHDLGFLNVDRAAMNKAVFKALKRGGQYVIADHSGRPGTGISESGTLHRIEEAFLRKEVEAAGFKLIAEGNFLRNPNDPRDKNTPDPPMPKDEFFLKFTKP